MVGERTCLMRVQLPKKEKTKKMGQARFSAVVWVGCKPLRAVRRIGPAHGHRAPTTHVPVLFAAVTTRESQFINDEIAIQPASRIES